MAEERIDIDRSDDEAQIHLHVARYEFAGTMAAGKRVLDVACGTGYGVHMLAARGASHAIGVDVDPTVIADARSRYKHPNVDFEVADAGQLSFEEQFDMIVSFETIEHVSSPEQFLGRVRQCLRPGGIFLVSTPCRQRGTLADRPANPSHIREWNKEEFYDLLSEHFEEIEMFAQLIEFAKNHWPLNRTFARLVCRILHPTILDSLHHYQLMPFVANSPFRLRIAYMVAVCRCLNS